MRVAAPLAVLLVLACVACVAWLLADPGHDAAPVSVSAPPSADAGPVDELRTDLAPAAATPTAARPEHSRPTTTGSTDEPLAQGEHLVAEGRFRLRLPDGSARDDLGGEATLLVWRSESATASTGSPHEVAVVDGRFQIEVLAGDALQVRALVLDGTSAVPLEPDRQHPADQGPLVIEVRHVPALVIHVTDAASGAHLDQVELRVRPLQLFGMAAGTRTVGRGERLVSDALSPVTVTPPTSVASRGWVTLDVRAADHADGQLGLDPSAGGSHHVALAAGAALEVFVEGAAPPQDSWLRLRRRQPDGPPTLEVRLGSDRPQLVEGLVPGLYHLQLELGDWHDQPDVLARASTLAVAGQRQRVVLSVDPAALPRPARLSGALVLPPHWRARNDALHLARVGQRGLSGGQRSLPLVEMQRVSGRDDLYLWDAGEVLTGRYELSLSTPYTAVLWDVGPDGVDDALLEIAPPGHLSVDIVDAHTGAALRDAALAWQPANPTGVGGRGEHLQRDATSGLYELVAPLGDVQLAAVAPGVDLAWTSATVTRGGGRTTLAARRHHDLVVLLDDGQQLRPVPGGLFPLTFEPLDGSGQRVAFGQVDGEEFVSLDEPGRYRVDVPTPVGFAQIPTQVIDVRGPAVTRHVIELLPP